MNNQQTLKMAEKTISELAFGNHGPVPSQEAANKLLHTSCSLSKCKTQTERFCRVKIMEHIARTPVKKRNQKLGSECSQKIKVLVPQKGKAWSETLIQSIPLRNDHQHDCPTLEHQINQNSCRFCWFAQNSRLSSAQKWTNKFLFFFQWKYSHFLRFQFYQVNQTWLLKFC